jgi:hypothetical protein
MSVLRVAAVALIGVFLALQLVSVNGSINNIIGNIYVGDQHAAGDLNMLRNVYNISAILNVAWDLDIRYPSAAYIGDVRDFDEHLTMQYNKVSQSVSE